MQPKITVVVPVYNEEKYLHECLDSVMNQTLDDIEILCINDGSTDRSPAILEKYSRLDPRIRIIHQENSGYGKTMNRAFDEAAGKYIAIVEADDMAKPEGLEKLYSAAETHQAEVVKADFYTFTGQGKESERNYCKVAPHSYFYGTLYDSTKSPALFYTQMHSWEGIYLNSFIKKHNIRHNTTPGAAFQDNGFWYQVFATAKRVFFVDEAFYMYRTDNVASSINDDSNGVYKIFEEFRFVYDYITKGSGRRESLMPTYYYYLFINLFARYDQVGKNYKLDFIKRVLDEYSKAKASGEMDFSILPSSIQDYLRMVEEAPAQFISQPHETIRDISWREIEMRNHTDEPIEDSIIPQKYCRMVLDSLSEPETKAVNT